MRINFFEEYPTEENLQKASFLEEPSTIYLAAHSLEEFFGYRTTLTNIAPHVTAGYWPILPRSYWISAFSLTKELRALTHELKNYKGDSFPVMLDLEPPLLRPSFFLRNVLSYSRNKKIIRELLMVPNFSIFTAELPLPVSWVLSLLGVRYSIRRHKHTRIIMYYSSLLPAFARRWMQANIQRDIRSERDHTEVALGTIATGVTGVEPILSPEKLFEDLSFLQNIDVSTATIFRLGGVTPEYMTVIKKFSKS